MGLNRKIEKIRPLEKMKVGPIREYKVHSFGWRLKLFFIIKQEKILLIYKMVIQTVLDLLDKLDRTRMTVSGLVQDVPKFLEGLQKFTQAYKNSLKQSEPKVVKTLFFKADRNY